VPDPTDKNYLKIIAIQKETLASVMTTQARVAGDTMRKGKTDPMTGLLERIKAAKTQRDS